MKPKPTIAQVIGYYPPHVGGSERVAQALAEQLAERGYDVRVLTSSIGAKAGRVQPRANLAVRRFKAWEFAHTPLMPGLVPAIFRLPRDSIIHLHLGQAFYPEVVWLAAKLRRLPYIVHFHLDLQPSGPLGGLFLVYKATLLRMVITQANQVIVFSAEQQTLVHTKYGLPRDRIAIIPNGVGSEYFRPARAYSKPARNLLNIGRLSPQKRLQILITAMTLLPKTTKLTLVGGGESRDSLQRQVRLLQAGKVIFTGPQSPAETLKHYRQADIFVISSEIEGMPLVVLEAMAGGLPVVASDANGLRELVRGVGILVKDPSGPAFARALAGLMADPKRLSVLSKQSRNAAAKYTWEKLANNVEDCYARVRP